MSNNVFLLCFLALTCSVYAAKRDCSVRIRGSMSDPTPLILESGEAALVTPNRYADVEVKAGSSIDLYCSDSFTDFKGKLLTAKCVSGVRFEVNGKTHDFKDFRCRSWPKSTAKSTGKSCAAGKGQLLSVGYEVNNNRFVQQYEVCFNEDEASTYWSKYELGAYSKYYQTKVDRINFKQDDFFGNLNVNSLYTKNRQKKTINNILGTNAAKYFDDRENVFLARGHLAAKADFVYGAGEQSSFYFINVAPQWQCINSGNWGEVEIIVRDLANSRRSSFTTYSGTYGVSTLPNKSGKQTPIYLYQNTRNNNNKIPVPKIYYRVIYEPPTQRGVVLVSVNDPHKSLSELKQQGYILCNDISAQLSYFDGFSTRTNLQAGYTYACTIADFAKQVPELPQINAVGGLLN